MRLVLPFGRLKVLTVPPLTPPSLRKGLPLDSFTTDRLWSAPCLHEGQPRSCSPAGNCRTQRTQTCVPLTPFLKSPDLPVMARCPGRWASWTNGPEILLSLWQMPENSRDMEKALNCHPNLKLVWGWRPTLWVGTSCLSNCPDQAPLVTLVPIGISPGAGMVVDWEQETGLLMSSGDVRIIRIWDTDREMKVQVSTLSLVGLPWGRSGPVCTDPAVLPSSTHPQGQGPRMRVYGSALSRRCPQRWGTEESRPNQAASYLLNGYNDLVSFLVGFLPSVRPSCKQLLIGKALFPLLGPVFLSAALFC